MKDNPRVQLPKPRPAKEERVFESKDAMREQVFKDYVRQNCDEHGNQRVSNLTKQQQRGRKKIKARTKTGEIVNNQTDKSGRMSMSSRDNYSQQGAAHVA